jgi:hypothetical protein
VKVPNYEGLGGLRGVYPTEYVPAQPPGPKRDPSPSEGGTWSLDLTSHERQQLAGSVLTTPLSSQDQNPAVEPARGRESRQGQARQGTARQGNPTDATRGYRVGGERR